MGLAQAQEIVQQEWEGTSRQQGRPIMQMHPHLALELL
jgi:hypothetical protein